jgi:hypothetical protein
VIFGEFPVEECEGLLLAHSLRLAGRTLKKGRRVASADFPELIAAGHERIYGARLDAGDLGEDAAAAAVAALLQSDGIVARKAYTGRCNLHATHRGLVTVDAGIIDRLNAIDEAVTVATLAPLSPVRAGGGGGDGQDHSAGGGAGGHRSLRGRGRARRGAGPASLRAKASRADRHRAGGRPGKELRLRRHQQPTPHRGPRQPPRPGAALRPPARCRGAGPARKPGGRLATCS